MHQKQQLYIKQATACGYKRYEFTANLGDVLEVVSDNKLKICSSTNNTYCHADVTSATDYSPFGAPLPERQYTAGLQATHTVAAAHFNGSTSGWQAHGANSVVSSYCGNLRAVITNRGSQGQGMKKTFATTPGQLYKVSFLINVMAWPALVITDPTTGAELLRMPTNMPGQYSYTFMAQSTHTTIAFEEIVATNSTILLCNFTLQEVGDRYVAGFQGQHADDEVAGAGNSYTAEFWQYDSRLGRRWNVDPITYPWQSSYAVFNNCPLVFIDPLGLEPEGDPKKTKSKTINVPLDEVVIRAKRPSWFKSMQVKFKNIFNPSDEYKAYKNAQKQETKANAKPKGEYKSYGWTNEQNLAASKFILSATIGIMTGGLASAYSIGGTGLMAAVGQYGTGALTRGGLDLATQLTVNGGEMSKVDFADVGMAAVFNPKYSAIIGSLVDFKAGQLQVTGLNKSVTASGIDLITKSTFGGIGLGGKVSTALEPLSAPQLNFLFQLPINLIGKITGQQLKSATSGQ